MVSNVNLVCYNDQGTAMLIYRLSPGCTITKQLNKGGGNILAAIPYAGFLGIDMGLIEGNVVTVTGQLLYEHNTRKPITVLQEIDNVAVYKNTTNNDIQAVNGNWHLIIRDANSTNETVNYTGLPKMVTYSIAAGEGDICNYTIQLDVTNTVLDSTGA